LRLRPPPTRRRGACTAAGRPEQQRLRAMPPRRRHGGGGKAEGKGGKAEGKGGKGKQKGTASDGASKADGALAAASQPTVDAKVTAAPIEKTSPVADKATAASIEKQSLPADKAQEQPAADAKATAAPVAQKSPPADKVRVQAEIKSSVTSAAEQPSDSTNGTSKGPPPPQATPAPEEKAAVSRNAEKTDGEAARWATMTDSLVEASTAEAKASAAQAAQKVASEAAKWATISGSLVEASVAQEKAAAAQVSEKVANEASKWATISSSLVETSTAEAKAAAAQAAEKVAREAAKWATVTGSLVETSTAEAKAAAAQVAQKVAGEAAKWATLSGSLVETSSAQAKAEAAQVVEKVASEAAKWATISDSLVEASVAKEKAAAAQAAEKVAREAEKWATVAGSLVETSTAQEKAAAAQVAEKVASEATKWAKISESLVETSAADAKAAAVATSEKKPIVGKAAQSLLADAPVSAQQVPKASAGGPVAERVPATAAAVPGGQASVAKASPTAAVATRSGLAAEPETRRRMDCINGCCFALVVPIILAHSARFGTKNKAILRLVTQENVLVGAFFAILGYVAAISSTKVGERRADERKLAKPELFFWSRVFSYYPLHFIVSTVFAPMFVAVERSYGTPLKTTIFRAFLNFSLLQAWFPKQAQVWNQPAWFLSSLTFSNLAMPLVISRTAALSKVGLRKLFYALTGVSVLQKLSYSQTARFRSRNIATTDRQYPLIWNMTRLHPFWSLLEMTTGIAAARDVMLDTEADRRQRQNPLVYFAAAHSALLLRATPWDFNDGIVRSALFVPLYAKFLAALHRDCQSDSPHILTRVLRSAPISGLGSLTFSMFLLHAPIGQLLYKKSVATRLWGRPLPRSAFPAYLLAVLVSSFLVSEHIVKSDFVQRSAGAAARWLASRTEGMLQDRV